jgi:hypothetical protein
MAKKKKPISLADIKELEIEGKLPTRSARKLITARKAKRAKAHRRKVAGAKRTTVGQALQRRGVPLTVDAKDMTLTKVKTTKRKIAAKKGQTKRKITTHMKRASLFRVSGTTGNLRPRARRILTDAEGFAISPRARPMIKGVSSPFAKPPKDMPQSTQDYFLSSRAIRRKAYDPATSTLEIVFTTGWGYHFYDVPYSVWLNFQRAQSQGRFFMEQIYGYWSGPKGSMKYHPNYNYKRIF